MNPRLPLLVTVCLAPRRTMRWMVDHPEPRQSFAVVVAAVLSHSLTDANPHEMSGVAGSLGLPATLVLGLVVICVVLAISTVMFFALAGAATVAGRWLGGAGTFGSVRTALSWGLAPQVWALAYRLPVVLFWPGLLGGRNRTGSAELAFSWPELSAGFIAVTLLELGTLAWYLVVGSRTLAEAQEISSWRGFGNLLLAVVLPFVGLMVVIVAAYLALKTT